VGSACLFFSLAPQRALLGDLNHELIELYEVIKSTPERLHIRLARIKRDGETYMRWRKIDPARLDRETRALRFLYLNRNCFNGIYRTNLSGQFNVPMGKKLGPYPTRSDFMKCADLLNNARLFAGDFERTIKSVKEGDFVYLDPPYAVRSRRVFREYDKHSFDTTDIERFSHGLTSIADRGADFLVSYADCSEARAISRAWNSVRLPVKRHVAGDLLPVMPPFIGRVCSGYAPGRGVLQTPSV